MNPLSCQQARRLLGASRRDDWTAAELAALGAHLTACAECRKVEAQYREVGEHVRQLPSTLPPPWFRDRVFAAIAADQRRIAARAARTAVAAAGRPVATDPTIERVIERVAVAETDPRLAAISLLPRKPQPLPRRVAGAVRSNTQIVAALAAMLLLALLGAALVPASPYYLFHHPTSISQYTTDTRITRLASAAASSAWIAYAGPDASGQYLLLAQSRQGGRPIALASGSSAPVTIAAVTSNWVLWRETDGADWRLAVSALPSGQTTTLLDSTASGPGAAVALHDVWASGSRVLAAVTTRGGSGMLARYDLSSGTSASVIQRAEPGIELVSPSYDGSTYYYWASIRQDAAGRLQSSVWRSADAAHTQQVISDDEAFHPQVAHGMLVWIAASSAPKTDGSQYDAGLAAAVGAVQERNLGSGDQRQIGANAAAASLAAAGQVVIWQSGGKTYTYDLGAQAPSPMDTQVRGASVVGLSDTALAWARPGTTTLNVYDLR